MMLRRRIADKVTKRGPAEGPERSSDHQQEVGMTRTDVMASSRPKAVGAVSMRMRSSGGSRRFLAIPVALLLAAALGAPTAVAATGETGHAQQPAEPKTTTTTTTTTTTPKSGTSPAKEVSPSKAA